MGAEQTRPDQTRPDRPNQTRPDQTRPDRPGFRLGIRQVRRGRIRHVNVPSPPPPPGDVNFSYMARTRGKSGLEGKGQDKSYLVESGREKESRARRLSGMGTKNKEMYRFPQYRLKRSTVSAETEKKRGGEHLARFL